MKKYVVVALYKFVDFPDFKTFQGPLKRACHKAGIKGTLLLAHEGINGTIAGTREGIDQALDYLRRDARFADIDLNESHTDILPFYRMKVRLKKEIVRLGIEGVSPIHKVGQYLNPQEWDALLEDPEVVVIDTRNDYEYEIGTFKGAVNPDTQTFREFPEYVEKNLDPKKNKKVAMFCTGGIRCEKSTSYMLEQGYDEVYHLKGGILKYLEETPAEKSKWEGECFVFDNRVAVTHGVEQGTYDQCHACRYPITESDKQSEQYEKGVSCPRCHSKTTAQKKESFRSRQKQVELAKARGEAHIGAPQVKV